MKKYLHIMVTVVALLNFGNVAVAMCSDAGVCGQGVSIECVDSDIPDDDSGYILEDCDDNPTVYGVTDEVDCGQTSRVCDTRPTQSVQVRNHTGRNAGDVLNRICGQETQVRRLMLSCYRSASVYFPLCASANDRIVALRRIIR